MKVVYFLVVILALTSSVVSAYDPSPLQDFCVAAKEKDGGMYKQTLLTSLATQILINFFPWNYCDSYILIKILPC